ncbi:MAG: hypothetical protein KC636_31650, partial [Myxococcales bacterium]|nr:hypothetical protein [Myxococcales bacterium]
AALALIACAPQRAFVPPPTAVRAATPTPAPAPIEEVVRPAAGPYTVVALADAPSGGGLSPPRINNHGVVVWTVGFTLQSNDPRITARGGLIAGPDLNDRGLVVWQQAVDAAATPDGWEVYADGARLTHNDRFDGEPHVTDDGEVVWVSTTGVRSSRRRLELQVDGAASLAVSGRGELVFRAGAGATSRIVSSERGVLGRGDHPAVNRCGEVVWMTLEVEDGEHQLVSSVRGPLGAGAHPSINDAGTIAFTRLEGGRRQLVALRAGALVAVAPGFEVPYAVDLNDRGEIAFIGQSPRQFGVFVARPKAAEGEGCSERPLR